VEYCRASSSASSPAAFRSSSKIREISWRPATISPAGTSPTEAAVAHAAMAGAGGIGSEPRPYSVRSRTTSVPASRSPIRCPRREEMLAMAPGRPTRHTQSPLRPPRAIVPSSGTLRSANSPANARASACRNRSGPPSTRTTRRPTAAFPIDRPVEIVSQNTG